MRLVQFIHFHPMPFYGFNARYKTGLANAEKAEE
jgi:hypothetical protein